MTSQRPIAYRQRGVATVFIAMVLLLAMGLIALYTSRSAIVEQRVSANEVRAKQALAAAMGGLDHALAQIRETGSNVAAVVPAAPASAPYSTYRAIFVAANTAAASFPVCGDTPAAGVNLNGAAAAGTTTPTLLAVSCGWSDDSASVQRVMQLFERRPPFSGPPSVPLVTKGGVKLGGNPAVFNFFNDLTVWSGATLGKHGSPSSTFIRDIATYPEPDVDAVDYRPVPPGSKAPPGYVQSTTSQGQDVSVGHDMVGSDTALSTLSEAEFFKLFMGMEPAAYKSMVPDLVVASFANVDAADRNGKVIWVEAPNDPLATHTVNVDMGTPDEPVVLVVKGFLDVQSAVINGLIFVLGDAEVSGNSEIYGGLISSGQLGKGNGTPSIVYDPYLLTKAKDTLGSANKLAGTWRDW